MIDSYLVGLIEKAIDVKRKLINESKSMKDLSIIIDNRAILDAVNVDVKNIVKVDDEILKDIINKFYFLNKSEKEQLLTNLLVIKDLLQSNEERGTTFDISDTQRGYIYKFFEDMNKIIIDQQERYTDLQNLDLDAERDKMQRMGRLLDNIVNKRNIVNDIDTISEVLKINEISELEKRELIIDIMEYNRGIYEGEVA